MKINCMRICEGMTYCGCAPGMKPGDILGHEVSKLTHAELASFDCTVSMHSHATALLRMHG